MEFLLPSKVTSFFLSFFFQTNTVVLMTSITSIFTCHSFDSIFLPLLCDCSSFFSILFTFLFSLFGGYSMFQLTLLSCFVSKLLCFFFSLLGVNVHLHAHHLHTTVHFLGNNRFDDGWGIGSFPQQCLIGDSTGITGTRIQAGTQTSFAPTHFDTLFYGNLHTQIIQYTTSTSAKSSNTIVDTKVISNIFSTFVDRITWTKTGHETIRSTTRFTTTTTGSILKIWSPYFAVVAC
mmetsp:Transcript_50157/g.51035  ORF Transcript_50157/g.51035 Transcript_50157/m.51035 type:complete len:234 (-) Transcript_50157:339-1040(-)